MKELYTVHPPRLTPIDVWAHDAAEAQHLAAAWWQYSGDVSGLNVDYHPQNDEAALAGATAQDGKRKNGQDQDTTVPARGQHVCGWFSECKCLCETCRRDFLDDDDNSCCLEHIGRSCPVTACPDYLPEEAPPC
jgi:hypothetical protein